MKSIQTITIAALLVCNSVHAMQQYKLPLVGQLTPKKALGLVAAGVVSYVAWTTVELAYRMKQLRTAMHNNQLDVVRKLIQQYPYLCSVRYRGSSPLHGAVYLGNEALVTLLLELGAPEDIKNKAGKTAEEFARDMGRAEALAAFTAHRKQLAQQEIEMKEIGVNALQ